MTSPKFITLSRELLTDLIELRIKDPSFNAVFDELQHLTSPFSQTLVRRISTEELPPSTGEIVSFNWELFSVSTENPPTLNDDLSAMHIIYRIDAVENALPASENLFLVKGSFRVTAVSHLSSTESLVYLGEE